MRCVRWWLRRWRPDLVPHGAALGASGPSPGRTTRRQLSLCDQALAVGTVLVGAGRYPPPPPFFPLLLRQPATAKLSTRTSRTAMTTNKMRLMAYLLVPVSFSVPENQPHRKRFPASASSRSPMNSVRPGSVSQRSSTGMAVTNGRPRFGGTAGRRPFDSRSWDNAGGDSDGG